MASATLSLTGWEAPRKGSTLRRPFSASSVSRIPRRPTFLTTLNSFTTNIASPAAFNPANSNVVYTPPDSKWPYIQNWFLSVQRQLPKDTVFS